MSKSRLQALAHAASVEIMSERPDTPMLDRVSLPQDTRDLSTKELQQLADELRQETISAVSETGGHLGAGLGVVELTVAIHHVFDTPNDRLIWDVGHQCYPHKILTGRRERIRTLRQDKGLSGFVKRSESEYDPFGTAHSSTSISAGLGMVSGAELNGEDRCAIAVIGDGSISAGMAYEAMNNAGSEDHRLIVILNDNDMSIDPPVGAMNAYLNRLISSRPYLGLREISKSVAQRIFPTDWTRRAKRAEAYSRGLLAGGTMFEELGFYYVGPVDGHNLEHLLPILKNVRDNAHDGPFLVHVRTQKGKGYKPAEEADDKYHGVAKFDIVTGAQFKPKPNAPSYTSVFGSTLVQAGELDDKIVAVTAAMPTGTGVNKFAEAFPDRCFDVGIAEQHAVTFAAGLATEGFKPFCAIYSTFLQRGYDQLVHDVVIQKLPVRFILDRAGFVGADGQTHHGLFDLAFLCCLPGIVVMAPSDEAELRHMVTTAAAYDDGPSAIRYPRGEGVGIDLPTNGDVLEIGKGRIVKQGNTVAILSLGARLGDCMSAAEQLDNQGFSTTVADARFAKPIDQNLIDQLVDSHDLLMIVEEGSNGGFGAHVLQDLAARDKLQGGAKVKSLTVPDRFYDQASPKTQIEWAGLDVQSLVDTATQTLTKGNNTRATG